MNSTKLPAGLIDNNIELFEKDGKYYVLQNGYVTLYEESITARRLIQQDMQHNLVLVALLSDMGYHGYDLEVKWVFCRYGGFDNVPDIDIQNKIFNSEYHECKHRATCKLSGIVCKIPGKLTHKELETIKAFSIGDSAKMAADKLNVKFNTVRAYLKSIHSKIGAHSRADVINFAYKNNII